MDNDFNKQLNAILEELMMSYDGANLPAFAEKITRVRELAKPIGDEMVSRGLYDQLREDYIARFFGKEPVNQVVEAEVKQSVESAAGATEDVREDEVEGQLTFEEV